MSIGPWRFRYPRWLLIFLLILGGCTTVADMRPRGPVSFEEGVLIVGPYDKVFTAALRTVDDLGLALQEFDPVRRYIVATHGISWWSFGEVVGIYFVPVGAETRVLVMSKTRYALTEGAKDWRDDVYRGILVRLGRATPFPSGK